MNNFLFTSKLAAGNIRKNSRIYVPYIITSVAITAMFYMISSLAANSGISNLRGADMIRQTMTFGIYIVGIFAVIFLFYTNSFLMKRREKEFGLYNVLGMGKNHISRVACLETVYIYIISMILGITLGVILDKAFYLVILKILGYNTVLGFYISSNAIIKTIVLFAVIFMLITLYSIVKIKNSNTIELVRSENTGEKEPKSKWIMTILGVVTLGSGYAIAVVIDNALDSLVYFFVAVILVIIGTYLIFTAGSIVLLKALRKNKKLYYQTRHFIGISGMLYRMKRNAVGLGNICILSTMVLVMISSTTSLMVGNEDIIKEHFPNTLGITSNEKIDRWEKTIDNIIKEDNLKVSKIEKSKYLSFTTINTKEDFKAIDTDKDLSDANAVVLNIITVDQYNDCIDKPISLKDNQVMVLENDLKYNYDNINILNNVYDVKETSRDIAKEKTSQMAGIGSFTIVVKNDSILKDLEKVNIKAYGENASYISYYKGYNIEGDDDKLLKNYEKVKKAIFAEGFHGRISSQAEARNSFVGSYGGIFFLAVFLGILFTLAMILIIYYKQISEGYEDKKRFEIMQNVGLSTSDIKASIKSQTLMVFFLPLVTAGVHVAFAFNMIRKILMLFGLFNTTLYVICTIVSFIVFSLLYGIIYFITAKTYYRIVRKNDN